MSSCAPMPRISNACVKLCEPCGSTPTSIKSRQRTCAASTLSFDIQANEDG
jgi:hypothetical protein